MYSFISAKDIIGILHSFLKKICVHSNINYFIINHLLMLNQTYQNSILRKQLSEKLLFRKLLSGKKNSSYEPNESLVKPRRSKVQLWLDREDHLLRIQLPILT